MKTIIITLAALILGFSNVNAFTPKKISPTDNVIEYPKWAIDEKVEGLVVVQVAIENGEIKVVDAVSNDSRLKNYIVSKISKMYELLESESSEMLLRFEFKLL